MRLFWMQHALNLILNWLHHSFYCYCQHCEENDCFTHLKFARNKMWKPKIFLLQAFQMLYPAFSESFLYGREWCTKAISIFLFWGEKLDFTCFWESSNSVIDMVHYWINRKECYFLLFCSFESMDGYDNIIFRLQAYMS